MAKDYSAIVKSNVRDACIRIECSPKNRMQQIRDLATGGVIMAFRLDLITAAQMATGDRLLRATGVWRDVQNFQHVEKYFAEKEAALADFADVWGA